MLEGIINYSPTHDLEWLTDICRGAISSNPTTDYEKGHNQALRFVIEIVERGMQDGRNAKDIK